MKTVKSYEQALDYLGGKRERPYAHNTRLENEGDYIAAKYHGNTVAKFYPMETAFYSCGWKTITTKERINWFLPEGFYCYQEKSVWYISKQGVGSYVFAEGIVVTNGGEVLGNAPDEENEQIKKQIKRIKKYVEGYIKALLDGKVPEPSGGDCWYCVMRTEDGESLGDKTGNSDHIKSHLKESYYVPAMLYNAAKFHSMSEFAKGSISQIWAGQEVSEWQKDIMTRDIKASLTAYIKHCLNIAA